MKGEALNDIGLSGFAKWQKPRCEGPGVWDYVRVLIYLKCLLRHLGVMSGVICDLCIRARSCVQMSQSRASAAGERSPPRAPGTTPSSTLNFAVSILASTGPCRLIEAVLQLLPAALKTNTRHTSPRSFSIREKGKKKIKKNSI
jgi:hypothetical protein